MCSAIIKFAYLMFLYIYWQLIPIRRIKEKNKIEMAFAMQANDYRERMAMKCRLQQRKKNIPNPFYSLTPVWRLK